MKHFFFVVLLCLFIGNHCLAQTCVNDICEAGENKASCPRDCWLDTIQLLLPGGGRVDWAKDGSSRIAFDMKDQTDDYFDVFTMMPDTSLKQCLTCGNPLVPQKNNGQPAWHPSGNWIVFQAEKTVHNGGSTYSTPGRGVYCDLWLISPDGSSVCQLTNLPDSADFGVLHPHFSNDGKKLSWSQMFQGAQVKTGREIGSWTLKVADFNGCALSNIRTFMPGDSVFYENHGFSPDDSSLIFTSNFLDGQSVLTHNNIYTLNIYTLALKQMTDLKYNEHADYIPGSSKISWGCNRDNQVVNPGMDFWIMNSDSSNKQRLTYFNKTGHYESAGASVRTVDHSWNRSGDSLVAYVSNGSFLSSDSGDIFMLKFHGSLTTGYTDVVRKSKNVLVYPNPFTHQTTIDFDNPQKEKHTLNLFDSKGRLVKTIKDIVDERIELEARNYTSGLYFFQLLTEDQIIGEGKLMIE